VQFANSARYELGVLGAEIKDKDLVPADIHP